MKTVVSPRGENASQAAGEIMRLTSEIPGAVLALAWDEDLSELYAALADAAGGTGLNGAKLLQVMEFGGEGHAVGGMLLAEAARPLGIPDENVCFFDTADPQAYEGVIRNLGGIDICVLSLGYKGQFGFNEPGAQFASLCGGRKLTESTRRLYSGLFGGPGNVPEEGCSMGVKTVCSARNIIIYASGEEKADAVFSTLYARDDSVVPSAFLQLPLNVTLFADSAAASHL